MFRGVIMDIALPGRCSGMPSVRAAYAIGIGQALLLVLALLNEALWALFAVGMGLWVPQLFLHAGIVWAKVRELLPQPTGHAKMFHVPPPLIGVGWLHCLGGLFISIAVLGIAVVVSRAT